MLFLFMPMLNAAIKNMSKLEYDRLLIVIIIFMCGYENLKVDPFKLAHGYSFLWLAMVYLFGAYIRLYNPIRLGSLRCFVLAGIVAFIPSIRQLLAVVVGHRIPGDSIYLVGYVSVFTLAVAILIFVGCLSLRVKNDKTAYFIKSISVTTFGVYLIHVQPFVWDNIWRANLRKIAPLGVGEYLVILLSLTIAVFAILTVLELLRLKLFQMLRINLLLERVDVILPR